MLDIKNYMVKIIDSYITTKAGLFGNLNYMKMEFTNEKVITTLHQ